MFGQIAIILIFIQSHLLERSPVKDIHQTALIYQRLSYLTVCQVDGNDHWIILQGVNSPEVMISENNVWHTVACPSVDYVDALNSPKMSLSGGLEGSPPLNPPKMVLTTVLLPPSRRVGLLSLEWSLLALPSLLSLGLLFLRSGLLPLRLHSWYRPYCFRPFSETYFCKCPAWINSSILSLRIVHSPVVWQWQRWYR